MLLLRVANVFLVYLYLLSIYVYFDAEFEELEEGLWPGHGQIMMFILMSRAGLKLVLMLMQILSFSEDIEADL